MSNVFVVILAFIIMIAPLVILLGKQLTTVVPINYFLLLMFTLGQSCVASYICSYYTADSVMFAIIFFCITTATLFLASLFMRDFNSYTCLMVGALIVGCVFQLAAVSFGIITLDYDVDLVLEGTGGSIIYGVYVLIDLKLI